MAAAMNALRATLSTQMIDSETARAIAFRRSGACTAPMSPPKMAMLPIPVQAKTIREARLVAGK